MAGKGSGLTIEEEGRRLVERLGGRWSEGGGMCRCPVHEDRTPSLSVRPGRTRLLLHCFAGCRSADILRAIRSAGLIEPTGGCGHGVSQERSGNRLNAAAVRLWSESRPIAGTEAEHYLAGRGLATDSPQLRYHALTPLGAKPATIWRPALIAAVRDESGLVAVHRTFLPPERPSPAARTIERRGLGRYGRGAVRLGGITARLGLAEGIETALSATALFGVPCWAALGIGRLPLVRLPPGIDELLLFLDNDSAGRRAESLARDAFRHVRSIAVHYPHRPGNDWNDVLVGSSPSTGRRKGEGASGG